MHSESNEAELIWRLLRKHVPEVTSGVIKVMGIVREPGKRSILAVASSDPKCDPVGTCVGLRGGRAKSIVSELGGAEMFDVVRWDESPERFIANTLSPLRIILASFEDAPREARVTVVQPSGSRLPDLDLRSRLVMNLTGWRLHVEVKHND
jgi:N utilization substance protein A